MQHKTMAKTTKTTNRKLRKAIAFAYNVNPRYIPDAIEDFFIINRKVA